MTRRQLASAIVHTREVAVTCVGILSYDGAEELFRAVISGSEALHEDWLGNFCAGDAVRERNENPIWRACWEGYRDPRIVSLCLANGWSPDEVDSVNGETPLMVAVKRGNRIAAANVLKFSDPDIGLRNFEGKTVVHLACEVGVDSILKDIFESIGSALGKPDSDGLKTFIRLLQTKSYAGMAPVDYAAAGGHAACLRLLAIYANSWGCVANLALDQKGYDGETPIARLARGTPPECLGILLPLTSSLNVLKDALHVAVDSGAVDAARLILFRMEAVVMLDTVAANGGGNTGSRKTVSAKDRGQGLASILNIANDERRLLLDVAMQAEGEDGVIVKLLQDHGACMPTTLGAE
ncbi:ankyrin repeat-containing domain protein [Hyaloraphidium curvatum]|nr:ankyrin repeat-containing domain protein [Hyaloraphidium curvatum]